MPPANFTQHTRVSDVPSGSWMHNLPVSGFVLEAWSQGFLVGAVIVMMGVTIANMTKALLHRLILVEVTLQTSPPVDDVLTLLWAAFTGSLSWHVLFYDL